MKYQYFILLLLFSFSISFFEAEKSFRYFSSHKITKEKLKKEILTRMERVDELRAMKELAVELGIKQVYLFGGSAAAWAHYVYWDLEREAGMGSYDKSRFDYDYTSIFRANQDMDIVVDVDPSNEDLVKRFEEEMQKRFPHFQGNKSAWEVRPLGFNYGEKDKILGNEDFLNQNSDSHSTGLISVTENDELGIRDFKDWEDPENHFFEDVFKRELHYYRDQFKHKSTKRFQEGLNPEIFSAIRYLTKAFQYELDIDDESLEQLKDVLAEFDSKKDLTEGYTKNWIEKNGKKLYQNAIDLEFAFNTMKSLGLLELLKKIQNNPDEEDSLAWWMNKQPLLRSAFGNDRRRKTAGELGIDMVAHETKSFAAYESITKSHSGLPNVFISRGEFSGEAAAYGDGFYTRIGKRGAAGTGLTIRFKVHPDAMNGVDFFQTGDYIIILNKAAIKVIPESLEINPVEYFEKLSMGELLFDYSDKGVLEKVRRKIGLKFNNISDNEFDEIYNIVERSIATLERRDDSYFAKEAVILEWFRLSFSAKYPQLIEKLFKRDIFVDSYMEEIMTLPHWEKQTEVIDTLLNIDNHQINMAMIKYVLSRPGMSQYPQFIKKLIDKNHKGVDGKIIRLVLSKNEWDKYPLFVEKLVERNSNILDLLVFVLERPFWRQYPKLMEKIIERGRSLDIVAERVLYRSEWSDLPELVEKMIDLGSANGDIVSEIFTKEAWSKHPHLLKKIIEKKTHDEEIIQKVLSKPFWKDQGDFVEILIERNLFNKEIIQYLLSRSHWSEYPQWVEHFLKDTRYESAIIRYALSGDHWGTPTHWIEKLAKNDQNSLDLIEFVFSQPHWKNNPEWIDYFLEQGKYDRKIIEHILGKEYWSYREDWVETLIDKGGGDSLILYHVLSQPYWNHRSDLVHKLIDKGTYNRNIAHFVLSRPHWTHHPELVAKVIDKGDADKEVLKYVLSNSHWSDHRELVEKLMAKGTVDKEIINEILTKESWGAPLDWFEHFLNKGLDLELATSALGYPHWKNHPELIERLVERGKITPNELDNVLIIAHWKRHPHFKKKLKGKKVSYKSIKQYLRKEKRKKLSCGDSVESLL